MIKKQAVQKPPPPQKNSSPHRIYLGCSQPSRHKSQLEAECLDVLKTIAGRLEWRLAGAYLNICLSETRRDFLLQTMSTVATSTPGSYFSTVSKKKKKLHTHKHTGTFTAPVSEDWDLCIVSVCLRCTAPDWCSANKHTLNGAQTAPSVLVLKPPRCSLSLFICWRGWCWWPGQQGQGYQTPKAFLFGMRGPAAVNPPQLKMKGRLCGQGQERGVCPEGTEGFCKAACWTYHRGLVHNLRSHS